jgi:hypothetical protein
MAFRAAESPHYFVLVDRSICWARPPESRCQSVCKYTFDPVALAESGIDFFAGERSLQLAP